MKAEFGPIFNQWYVDGVGMFDSKEEADKAVTDNTNSKQILLSMSPRLHADLKRLAKQREVSVSKLIRQILEKEVKNG